MPNESFISRVIHHIISKSSGNRNTRSTSMMIGKIASGSRKLPNLPKNGGVTI
jgi:hypothetical protein